MKRFGTHSRVMLLALAAILAVLLAAPAGRAQIEESVRPRKVEQPAKAPTWLYYLVGVASIAVCVGLAVFPGRRTHED